MKGSKILTVALTAIVKTSVLIGCGNTQGGTPAMSTVSENISPSETTAPTEAVETTIPPTIDVNEALTNVWRIVDNDCVEEIPILPGLLIDDIKGWMKETEYKEARLYQRTNWKTARFGVFGDMAAAQISMDDEDLVWNVRMEKSDKRENKTTIVIPESAETGELPLDDTNVTVQYFFWEKESGTYTGMYLL